MFRVSSCHTAYACGLPCQAILKGWLQCATLSATSLASARSIRSRVCAIALVNALSISLFPSSHPFTHKHTNTHTRTHTQRRARTRNPQTPTTDIGTPQRTADGNLFTCRSRAVSSKLGQLTRLKFRGGRALEYTSTQAGPPQQEQIGETDRKPPQA